MLKHIGKVLSVVSLTTTCSVLWGETITLHSETILSMMPCTDPINVFIATAVI